MFTLVAFQMTRVGATAVLTVTTPVPDQNVTIDGNNVVVPAVLSKLLGCVYQYGTGVAAGAPTFGQLQSPGLRRVFNPDISKNTDSLAALTDDDIQMYPDSPMPLDPNEGLQAWTAHAALVNGVAEVGVWLSDGPIAKAVGEIRTIRYTSVTPVALNVWTLGVLGVVQQLPQGSYAVVGARVVSLADSGLFRLIFTGYDWRPGGCLSKSLFTHEPDVFRRGNLGVWGTFDWMHLPRIEVISMAQAPAANPDIYLDLIKVS